MPAYTHLRTFVNALKSGRTHITDCLDAFFQDPANVQASRYYADFTAGSWSGGTPSWLPDFFDSIGLTAEERDHVLQWPLGELERTRNAAATAAAAGQTITFRWGIYDGPLPMAVVRTGPSGNPEVLFQSPGASLRLTQVNYGEVYVEEV